MLFDELFDATISCATRALPISDDDIILREELNCLSPGATPKRKAQFILGRLAARSAMSKLGVARDAPVLKGGAREPIWPEGVVGSISHAKSFAVAAVARSCDLVALGVDLEVLTPENRSEIVDRICHAGERDWALAPGTEAERSHRALTIFSAKESIYKALFPICRHRAGFLEVELLPSTRAFNATLLTDWGEHFKKGYRLNVCVTENAEAVFTHVAVKRGASQG